MKMAAVLVLVANLATITAPTITKTVVLAHATHMTHAILSVMEAIEVREDSQRTQLPVNLAFSLIGATQRLSQNGKFILTTH